MLCNIARQYFFFENRINLTTFNELVAIIRLETFKKTLVLMKSRRVFKKR